MRVEIDLTTLQATHDEACRVVPRERRTLYVSAGLEHLKDISGLAEAEYGHGVELDAERRTVRFGRDYLGHFPLLYACAERALFVSDDVSWIVGRLRAGGTRPTLSEEALALYFAMGYVPAGRSLYREVVACEGQAIYEWRRGRITKTSFFRPVDPDPRRGLADLGEAIESEVRRWAAASDEIDVWCSGGIDSSIMACAFNAEGRHSELLTVGYGRDIHDNLGEGEKPYAYDVAAQCGAPIREIALTAASFERAHERFVATHHMPVIDTCVPPKYALADASRRFVITGEGSDPLFGGPKNNAMVYAQSADPAANLGWHYAMAHERWFGNLARLMRHGAELADYVVDYLNGLFARYPGDLIRKLFYINTHVKAASLIFTESYYACRARGIAVRHPYSGLGVYRAAFSLEDRFKYRYPKSKLALHELYAGGLPESIVKRKKSGTVIPLRFYLCNFARRKFDFTPLLDTGLFNERFFRRIEKEWKQQDKHRSPYALLTLSEWLLHNGWAATAPSKAHGADRDAGTASPWPGQGLPGGSQAETGAARDRAPTVQGR
jgi:asparagine synthase (glutamine-hydrolysing)